MPAAPPLRLEAFATTLEAFRADTVPPLPLDTAFPYANQSSFAVPPHARLEHLLALYEVSSDALAWFSYQAYKQPQFPYGKDNWVGEAVLANDQGDTEVQDYIIPAALFAHNRTGARILAFQGLDALLGDPKTGQPSALPGTQACIMSRFHALGSAAAGALQATCDQYGTKYDREELTLTTVAEQSALILAANPGVVMVTGHSLGCVTALTVARLFKLPCVCFGAPQSFSQAWVEGWPGLSEVVTNSQPGNLFVLNAQSDPYSNCLTPRIEDDPRRKWAAAGCSFAGRSTCGVPPVKLSYNLFSACVLDVHPIQETLAVKERFSRFGPRQCSNVCETKISVCPYLPPPTNACQEPPA